MTRQHFEENTAEAVNVAAAINRSAGRLFGAHVRCCAQSESSSRELLVGYCLNRACNAEVGHHSVSVRKQNITRLDVAVDEALRVGMGESVGDFGGNLQCLTNWKRTVSLELFLESWPFHIRHDVVGQSVNFS